MKITIVYDNTVFQEQLEKGWGFSCFVEAHGHKILFDTGGNGSMLLSNMRKLNISPLDVEEIMISHFHGDHTGGMPLFLETNPIRVYIPASCASPRGAKEVIKVKDPITIHENIYSTGELKGVEQSLVIKIDEGLVIIVGCSHPGVENILNASKRYGTPWAIVGGLHGFRKFDLVKQLKFICPTHCTQYISRIKSLYPSKYIEGGAGKVIEF